MFYHAQLTVVQIAETLDINENTVKSRLALGRAKIRAALETAKHLYCDGTVVVGGAANINFQGMRLYDVRPALWLYTGTPPEL